MTRPGRPRTDRLELLERIIEVVLVEPTISGNALQRQVGGRRRDVQRIHKALRKVKAPPSRPEAATAAGWWFHNCPDADEEAPTWP